jgi:hypothetical protein
MAGRNQTNGGEERPRVVGRVVVCEREKQQTRWRGLSILVLPFPRPLLECCSPSTLLIVDQLTNHAGAPHQVNSSAPKRKQAPPRSATRPPSCRELSQKPGPQRRSRQCHRNGPRTPQLKRVPRHRVAIYRRSELRYPTKLPWNCPFGVWLAVFFRRVPRWPFIRVGL